MKLLFDKDHKRSLTLRDFDRAQIPDRLRAASLETIPAEIKYRADLTKYIENIDRNLRVGTGIAFMGPYGGGKSASAVIVAKEIMSRGGSVLFIEENALIGAVLKQEEYSEDVSMQSRAETVDLLIADDIGLSPQSVNLHVTETLIKHRVHRRKTTIITTNLMKKDFDARYRTIASALQEAALPILCEGVAWREGIAASLVRQHKQKES